MACERYAFNNVDEVRIVSRAEQIASLLSHALVYLPVKTKKPLKIPASRGEKTDNTKIASVSIRERPNCSIVFELFYVTAQSRKKILKGFLFDTRLECYRYV